MAKKIEKKEVAAEGLEDTLESPVESQENLVDVQMTPEQRDLFVKFMADEKDKLKELEEANKPEQMFVMDLNYEHNINGIKFGPGLAHIPQSMVATIQRGELRSVRREIALHSSNKRLFKVLQSGQAVPVASLPKGV